MQKHGNHYRLSPALLLPLSVEGSILQFESIVHILLSEEVLPVCEKPPFSAACRSGETSSIVLLVRPFTAWSCHCLAASAVTAEAPDFIPLMLARNRRYCQESQLPPWLPGNLTPGLPARRVWLPFLSRYSSLPSSAAPPLPGSGSSTILIVDEADWIKQKPLEMLISEHFKGLFSGAPEQSIFEPVSSSGARPAQRVAAEKGERTPSSAVFRVSGKRSSKGSFRHGAGEGT